MPKGIFLALANPVSEAVDAEFNQWYEDSHAREVLALPGVKSCTRYRVAGGQVMPGDDAMGYGYLALYEVEVDDWDDFSASMQQGFVDGKITIDANLLSMDPMVKTIVFEQVSDKMLPEPRDGDVKIGIFISDTGGERTGVDELQRRARWVEENGFTSAWVPHIPWSLDALTALVLAAEVTERIELGTAVVPTYPRHPLAMAQQALSVQAASGGRLTLGIGPSHPVVVENMHGLSYARPYSHTREYLEVLERALAGPGQVHYEGEEYRVNALLDVPGATPVPVLIAALAPKMLHLAGSRTQGTITWMADEQAIEEHVVPRLVAGAMEGGRPAPRVVAGLSVAVCDDAAEGRERAARLFSVYGDIPTYQRILATGEAAGPAEVAVVGTEAQVRTRLESFRDAGVTDLAAATFAVGDDRTASLRRTHELLASLAPEL